MRELKSINDFQEIIQGNKPVLLDFYADWCGPCKTLLRIVEKLAIKHESDFVMAKVNVDMNPELSQKFNIRSIPALFFIQDGEVKENINGLLTEVALDAIIQKYITVTTH